MKKKRRTKVLLTICIGVLVLATLFSVFLSNPGHYKITSNEGKCYVGLNPELIFKEGVEKFPIIKEVDCNLLMEYKNP